MTNLIDIQAVLSDPRFNKKLLEAASNFLQELSKEPPHRIPQTMVEHAMNPCCPVCHSEETEGSFIEVDDGIATQKMGCLNCGAEWVDTYALNGYCDLNIPEEE